MGVRSFCFKNETIQKNTKKDLQKKKGSDIINFAARKTEKRFT